MSMPITPSAPGSLTTSSSNLSFNSSSTNQESFSGSISSDSSEQKFSPGMGKPNTESNKKEKESDSNQLLLKLQEKELENKQLELKFKLMQMSQQQNLTSDKTNVVVQKDEQVQYPKIAFGKKKWETYFGDIGEEPPLPKDIDKILKSPCPFWPNQTIEGTHILVLVPATVNNKPLTLNSLGALVKSPKKGPASSCSTGFFDSNSISKGHGMTSFPKSRWVLMTRDVILKSRDKSYTDQQTLLSNLAKKAKLDYEVPHVLDAAVCAFMHFVSTKERLFSNKPNTYTRCQEKTEYQLCLGSFGESSLSVSACDSKQADFIGMAAMLELKAPSMEVSNSEELTKTKELAKAKELDMQQQLKLKEKEMESNQLELKLKEKDFETKQLELKLKLMEASKSEELAKAKELAQAQAKEMDKQQQLKMMELKLKEKEMETKQLELKLKEKEYEANKLELNTKLKEMSKSEKTIVVVQKDEQVPYPTIAFGKKKWETYFGDIGEEPPLPKNIDTILDSTCPIWKDKKVRETHMLVLIPTSVNKKPLTLHSLGELVKSPKEGNVTGYKYIGKYYGNKTAPKSYWVLMTREILPGSRNKSCKDQLTLLTDLAKNAKIDYEVPTALEATVCTFLHYISTKERLFNDKPNTYTRCLENAQNDQMSIGNFDLAGLSLNNFYYVNDNFGVAALWKF